MVVYAEWDTGLPSVQERIHEKYPIEGEVVPVYYGVYFHGCNLPVGCSSRKVSEGAKDGHIRQLISNSVALLLAVALGHNNSGISRTWVTYLQVSSVPSARISGLACG